MEKNQEKYLSVITNFGCHYACPYCITKNADLDIPKTTLFGLDKLGECLKQGEYNWCSVSGGGDPLFRIENPKVQSWYDRFFEICDNNNVSTELHTSIVYGYDKDVERCFYGDWRWNRIVYHLNDYGQLYSIKRHSCDQIVRVVFVVTPGYTFDRVWKIWQFVKHSTDIDELSFRELVDKDFNPVPVLTDYLKRFHKDRWWFIEQKDYNTYYAENEMHDEFKKYKKI